MKKYKLVNNVVLALTTSCVPLSLLSNCSQKRDISVSVTVNGCYYDKAQTRVELNKESTIYLVPKSGTTIIKVLNLQIGDKFLQPEQYSFRALNTNALATHVITIPASEMVATTINIEIEADEITVISDIELSTTIKTISVNNFFSIKGTLKYSSNTEPKILWSQSGDGEVELPVSESTSGEEIKVIGKKTGNVTLTATCGSVSKTCTVTVTNAASLTIEGDRNVDIDSPIISFIVKNDKQEIVTTDCTFSIESLDDPKIKLGTFQNNVLTLSDIAKKRGGSATIMAIYKQGEGVRFDVEIATFNKLKTTGDVSLSQGHALQKDTDVSGDVVIPSRYYVANNWKQTVSIPTGSFNAPLISYVFISKNIDLIEMKAFGQGLKTIDVSPLNNLYSSPTNSNCVINTVRKELIIGSIDSKIPTDKSIVNTIGDCAFYSSGIKTISIPSNITKIGRQAFALCTSLQTFIVSESITSIDAGCFQGCSDNLVSVEFTNKSSKWIQQNDSYLSWLDLSNPNTNATNFKNETLGMTGYNWCTTGICHDESAVKSSLVIYDEPSFKDHNITLVPDKCTQLVRNNDASRTITVNYEKPSESIVGYINVVNKKGEPVAKPLKNFELETTARTVTLDEDLWEEKINPQDTLTVSFAEATLSPQFNEVPWPDAITAINTFEAIKTPTAQDAITLCHSLNIQGCVPQADAKATLEHYLVGKLGIITLDGLPHVVRCIGCMHDDCWNGSAVTGKAALTFELASLLSDPIIEGVLTCHWDQKENKDFTKSDILLTNLNGTGSKATWYNPKTEQLYTNKQSVWEMLQSDSVGLQVANAIKVTQHFVPTTDSTWAYPKSSSYEQKLFLPSYYNVNSEEPQGEKSGWCIDDPLKNPIYKYYEGTKTVSEIRAKESIYGYTYQYWLSSPAVCNNIFTWAVEPSGTITHNYWVADDYCALTFCFAI